MKSPSKLCFVALESLYLCLALTGVPSSMLPPFLCLQKRGKIELIVHYKYTHHAAASCTGNYCTTIGRGAEIFIF